MFGVKALSLEKTLDLLHKKEFYDKHSPFVLAVTLKEFAECGHQEKFNQIADAYVLYIQQEPGEESKYANNPLMDLAVFCLNADRGWWFIKYDEERPLARYENPRLYGPAMNAFANYRGKKGIHLTFELWLKNLETTSAYIN